MKEIRHKDSIIKIIAAFYPQAKIYLFGSYARGTERASSDIDIAIDVGRELDIREWGLLSGLLDALPISHTVDLVDIHGEAVSDSFRIAIMKDAIVWKP